MDEDLNVARHHTVTECRFLQFWRAVNADLDKRGLAPAVGKEVSGLFTAGFSPECVAARIARARVPFLVALKGGVE